MLLVRYGRDIHKLRSPRLWKVSETKVIKTCDIDLSDISSTNDRNSIAEVNQAFSFSGAHLNVGGDNVITVVQDNMGLDESGG